MTNPAMEMARQRAQQDGAIGVTTDSFKPHTTRQSPSDWGSLRGPSDPNGDGGISTVSIPMDVSNQFDDGGLGVEPHPGIDPVKKLLNKPREELTEDESAVLFDYLAARERARIDERDAVALEHEKFDLTKKKSTFDLVKKFAIGFGVLGAFSFTALIGLLIWVAVKNTDFTDTSVIASILSTFSTFFQILANM